MLITTSTVELNLAHFVLEVSVPNLVVDETVMQALPSVAEDETSVYLILMLSLPKRNLIGSGCDDPFGMVALRTLSSFEARMTPLIAGPSLS